ncbi:MAG TPA: alpha/beta hydrolase-fold protein [Arenibaculum sp.]|nr:alpha/beta hydrolase-fold protein [Arenibaculum sp.]
MPVCIVAALCLRPGMALAEMAQQMAPECDTASSRYELLTLPAPATGPMKRIWIYLPPGYGCAPMRRYPAFFFNDGQDLFDWNPFAPDLDPAVAAMIAMQDARYGSWRLGGQLDEAAMRHLLPPLVVAGIASDDGMRSRDLAPVAWSGSFEGRGADHARFVARVVVPAVDRRYLTMADRRCRGIGGASLGGLSALSIALTHADTFGLGMALSPLVGEPALAGHIAAAYAAVPANVPSVLFIDVDDDAAGRADMAWFAALVDGSRHPGRLVALTGTPGGRHHISSWAERVIPALQWLFARSCPDPGPDADRASR